MQRVSHVLAEPASESKPVAIEPILYITGDGVILCAVTLRGGLYLFSLAEGRL